MLRSSLLLFGMALLAASLPHPAAAMRCEWGSGLSAHDVAPRTGPDGVVDVADVILTLRFAVGLDAPTAAELKRADWAPCLEGPDGLINVGDVVLTLGQAIGMGADCAGPPWAFGVGAESPCRREGSLLSLYGFDLIVDGVAPRVVIDGAEATVRSMVENAYHAHGAVSNDLLLLELGPSVAPHAQDVTPNVEVTSARGSHAVYLPGLLAEDCAAPPVFDRLTQRIGLGYEGTRLVVVGRELACVSELRLDGQATATRLVLDIQETDDGNWQLAEHFVSAGWPVFPTEELWDLSVTTDCGEFVVAAALDSRAGAAPLAPTVDHFDSRVRDRFQWTDRLGTVDMLGAGLGAIDRVSWNESDLEPADFAVSADGTKLTVTVPPPPAFAGESLEVDVRLFAGAMEATHFWGTTPKTFRYETPCEAICGSISPPVGEASGGTRVLVTAPWGSRLSAVDGVTFGGLPGTDLELVNDMQVRVTAPASSAGLVPVALESPGLDPATCETFFEYR